MMYAAYNFTDRMMLLFITECMLQVGYHFKTVHNYVLNLFSCCMAFINKCAGEKLVIPWGHTDEKFKNEDILTELLTAGRWEQLCHNHYLTNLSPGEQWEGMDEDIPLEMLERQGLKILETI